MSPTARIGFGVLALAVLSGVAWLSFHQDTAASPPPAAASPAVSTVPMPLIAEAVTSAPSSRGSSAEPSRQIPYDQLTTVARDENRVIYTTSWMGEPMEVHPDGLVVIYNHRQVLKFADGREEVRYITVRGRPKLAPAPILLEDETAPKTEPPK
jgi:hypothetical protein